VTPQGIFLQKNTVVSLSFSRIIFYIRFEPQRTNILPVWIKLSSKCEPILLKPKYALLIFACLSGLYFFSIFQRVGIAVIALDIMNELNLDTSMIGLMSAMYFFPYAIAQIPVGILLDRIGVRRTILYLSLIACLGTLLFSISDSIYLLMLGRALVGFGVGGYYVSSLKALAMWFKPEKFATLTGALTSIGNIGALAATSPLAILSLSLGWRGAFLIVFAFMMLFTIMAWFTIKDKEDDNYKSQGSISSDLKMILTNRKFLWITLIPLFVYGFFISFQGLWGGPFLIDVYGVSKSEAAIYLLFIGVGFMLLGPVAGFFSDRIERRKPILIAGVLISLAFWIIMAVMGNNLTPVAIPVVFLLLGIGFAFTNIYMTVAKEFFNLRVCGTSMACYNVFAFIGAGFFQYFMGVVLNYTYGGSRVFEAYQLIFILGVVLISISLIVSLTARETFKRVEGYGK
jgi:predicted MFS family arabinose efflux permease